MTRRMPIRWRLTLTTVGLIAIVLVIVGATVYVLERRSLDAELTARARSEAQSLLAVAVPEPSADSSTAAVATPPGPIFVDDGPEEDDDHGDEPLEGGATVPDLPTPAPAPSADPGALDASTAPYLVRRSGADVLLAARGTTGRPLVNEPDADALVALLDGRTGARDLTIDDESMRAYVSRDASGITAAAAVPTEDADERVAALLRALAVAGAIGLVLSVLLGWLAARSALHPLTVISTRAAAIGAGRLDQRVGPIAGSDEIARVSGAIDSMLDRLERSFRQQQRFVQDASHELRTPITIARGHLEVVDPAREEPAAVQASLDLAVDELDRMGRLVERLLVLARAGAIPADRLVPVDAAAIAADAVARVRTDEDGRHWEIDVEDGLQVPGDRDALTDALVNLLANAQRHTGPDGRIAIVARRDGASVSIAVVDDGEGIPADMLDSVFDRFTRADAARTRDRGGAGLGLAITRAYVEAHGGTIAVTSEHGHGATFTVRLPAHP